LLLRVAEARPKDVGRGLVRLDPQDLKRLGADIGDVVEIGGKRPAVARAMPAYAAQRGQGLIQMDGILRANAGTALVYEVVPGPDSSSIVYLTAADSLLYFIAQSTLAHHMDLWVTDGDRVYAQHAAAGSPLCRGHYFLPNASGRHS